MERTTSYDKLPTISASDDASSSLAGWPAIIQELKARINLGCKRIVVECYPGVDIHEVSKQLEKLSVGILFNAEQAFRSIKDLDEYLAPWLGDDPVFGKMASWTLGVFFDEAKLSQLRSDIANAHGTLLVYGTGAAYLAEHWDLLVYCDVTRWEVQKRQRSHLTGNIGADNASASPAELYKRAYFIDWRAADSEKHRLHSMIDCYIDTNRPLCPSMISGSNYRAALADLVRRPFRVVPFFDPGPWGGQWMRRQFDLPAEPSNYAWCFDCVPEENSLRFRFGGNIVETPALALVHEHPHELLGDSIIKRFGAEFPIRFDLLDTVEGGNLSLQVHPLCHYIAAHFGMTYTQDESYYLLDAAPGAVVYLGLKTGVDPLQMARDLEAAQAGGQPFPVEQYICTWPASKHDHFSIPAGTIHCSGKNSLVLEISATPYIFTFKLWDWGRPGLDGQPRPLHLKHGLANIQWNRDAAWVGRNLINPVRQLSCGDGWQEESTGLHDSEFLETRRHWFTGCVLHHTEGNLNVLNLVEGDEVVVESPQNTFEPFVVHYAETFIVPACVGQYRISPTKTTHKPLATVKAFVRR